MIEQNEILSEFLVEASESLDLLDRELLALEKDGPTPERLNCIFRGVHTIKGTAGFLGLEKLERVTHVGESLLDSLRAEKIKPNAEISAALFRLLDAMRKIMACIAAQASEGKDTFAELVAELKRLNSSDTSGQAQPEDLLERLLAENQKALWENKPSSDAVVAAEAITAPNDTPKHEAPAVNTSAAPQANAAEHGSGGNTESKTSVADTSLRVDVRLLDQLMNLVGELVLSRNQILQHSRNQKDQGFLNASQRLNLITTELQEGVMKTRMQQISNVWSKFPRVVRDLSKQLNKQVRLEMEGKETELDKTIIEAIKDPLTHIIRNSVDHGIEMPNVREKNGKHPEGVVTLRAFHEGGQVIIEIADDGAGLKTERIKQKALEKGVVSADQIRNWSTQEIHRIIFMPGFSTAEAVTNVSGRGVGMDVVRSNIERIGGQVDISSDEGKGSTIRIKIPLTLAIIPALTVSCSGERFAIPQVVLVELVRVDADNRKLVEQIAGAYFYRLRGNLLPLLSLSGQLGLGGCAFEDPVGFIFAVVKADEQSFGIVVDEVHDTEEIVVKPLGKQLKNLSVFAGATVMGDGSVALILDVLGLAKRAGINQSLRDKAADAAKERDGAEQKNQTALLVVRVQEDYQVAFPLAAVHRLEEFERKGIEFSGGKPVIQYRDGILPLIDLADFFLGKKLNVQNGVQVVVYAQGDSYVGFLVDKIEDIVEQSLVVHEKQKRRGTNGAIIVRDKVTELLNPAEIMAGI
jgi:two-component system chemotaxis sensor kinase CheA